MGRKIIILFMVLMLSACTIEFPSETPGVTDTPTATSANTPTSTSTVAPTNTQTPTATQPTATEAPAPTPTRIADGSSTPIFVTPIGGQEGGLHKTDGEIRYDPINSLLVREDHSLSGRWTGAYTGRDPITVYYVWEANNGDSWACMENFRSCKQWFAIRVDMNGDGIYSPTDIFSVMEVGPVG